VLVLQQGRSFDSYFGLYCQAAPGSNPTCEDGRLLRGMPSAIVAPTPARPWIHRDDHVPRDGTSPAWRRRPPAIRWASWSLHPAAIRPTSPARRPATPRARSPSIATPPHRSLADRCFQSTLDAVESNVIYLAKTAFGSSIPLEFGLQLTRIMAEQRVRWALYLGSADERAACHRSSSTATGIFFARRRDPARRGALAAARGRDRHRRPRAKRETGGRSGRGGDPLRAGVADAIAASPRYQAPRWCWSRT